MNESPIRRHTLLLIIALATSITAFGCGGCGENNGANNGETNNETTNAETNNDTNADTNNATSTNNATTTNNDTNGGEAPVVSGVEPPEGSSRTFVTITGEGFSDTATVLFGDVEAEIVSSSAEELVVVPRGLLVEVQTDVEITIERGGLQSDPYDWVVHPSGVAEALPAMFPRAANTMLVDDDGTVYVGDRAGALLAVDPEERLTRRVETDEPLHDVVDMEFHPTTGAIWLIDRIEASDAGGLDEGRVVTVDLDTGGVAEVIAPTEDLAETRRLAFGPSDELYLVTRSANRIHRLPDGGTLETEWAQIDVTGTPWDARVLNGMLFVSVGSPDSGIYVLDPGTGGVVNSPIVIDTSSLPEAPTTFGAFGDDGGTRIFVGTDVGILEIELLAAPNPTASRYDEIDYFVNAYDQMYGVVRTSDGGLLWLQRRRLWRQPEVDRFELLSSSPVDNMRAIGDALYWSTTSCNPEFPAGGALVRRNGDGTVKVVTSGTCGVDVGVAPDGRPVVTHRHEGRVYLVDPDTGELEVTVQGISNFAYSADFGADGNLYILHADDDDNAFIGRETPDGDLELQWGTGPQYAFMMRASDHRLLFPMWSDGVHELSLDTPDSPQQIIEAADTFDISRDVAVSPDGRVVVAGGAGITHQVDGSIEVLYEDSDTPKSFVSVTTMPSGQVIAWDLETGELFSITP